MPQTTGGGGVTFVDLSASSVAATNVNPIEVDKRPLRAPRKAAQVGTRATVGTTGAGDLIATDRGLQIAVRRNLWQYTETLSSSLYNAQGGTKQSDSIVVDGVTLTRYTMTNFYDFLQTSLLGNGITILTSGKRYLISYYAVARTDGRERFIHTRPISAGGDPGHGMRYLPANQLVRVSHLVQAKSTTQVDRGNDPTVAWGSGATEHPVWLCHAGNGTDTVDVYLGGFQIEQVADAALDGIALIGDSTMQGSAGSTDLVTSREVSRYVEGMLCCSVFNRAIFGNKLSDMDTRWAADITPLAGRSKYVIIQGGINDIVTGRTLAQMKTSLISMAGKAATDGLIPVFLTCTPTSSVAAYGSGAGETQRLTYNDWLKSSYGNVIDVAPVVSDPYNPAHLRKSGVPLKGSSTDSWYGDGIHYEDGGKRAVAELVAAWSGWDLPTPSPYQKIAAATFDKTPSKLVLVDQSTGLPVTVTVSGGALVIT